MRTILRLLPTALLVAALPCQEPKEIPDNTAEMAKLDWLVGTWVGTTEMPG